MVGAAMASFAPSKLTALQRDVLEAFFQRERGFFLTGGAALAGFHLGAICHRSRRPSPTTFAALRAATTTSYFKDGNTRWVKLVVEDAAAKGPVVVRVGNLRAQATIDVSKPTAVAAASPNELAKK